MTAEGKDYRVAHIEFSMWGGGISWLHRGIITGVFVEHRYD